MISVVKTIKINTSSHFECSRAIKKSSVCAIKNEFIKDREKGGAGKSWKRIAA